MATIRKFIWAIGTTVVGTILVAAIFAIASLDVIANNVESNEERIVRLEIVKEKTQEDISEIKGDISSINARIDEGNRAILRELNQLHETIREQDR